MRLRWLWVVPAALAVAMAVLSLGPYGELSELAQRSGGLLDEAPRSSLQALLDHVAAVGDRGRELYGAHRGWDALFIAANSALLAVLTAIAAPRSFPALRRGVWLLLIPSIAFCFLDLWENELVASAFAGAAELGESGVQRLRAVTIAKMGAFSLAMLIAVASLVGWGARRVLGRREKREPRSVAVEGRQVAAPR